MTDHQPLPPAAEYFPIDERFELKVGLSRLDSDFGNGAADARVFQIDRQWQAYRAATLAARRERLDKYVCRGTGLSEAAERALTGYLLRQLPHEYPQRFRRQDDERGVHLWCALTGETLHFDAILRLTRTDAPRPLEPPYCDGLDALACQVQEDLAFVATERLAYLHLCHPNHWAGEDKLDAEFEELHGPVPGFVRIARQSERLVQAMVERGPFVRFAWGVATDARLNHHPEPPPGWNGAAWRGRRFDPQGGELFLRIERQVMVGLPQVSGFLFTIRTYLRDVCTLEPDARRRLAAAIASMDGATAAYKGLAEQQQILCTWLASAG